MPFLKVGKETATELNNPPPPPSSTNRNSGHYDVSSKNQLITRHSPACLEGIEKVGEREHGEGERVQVPRLDQDLILQHDEGQHLQAIPTVNLLNCHQCQTLLHCQQQCLLNGQQSQPQYSTVNGCVCSTATNPSHYSTVNTLCLPNCVVKSKLLCYPIFRK